MMRIKIAIYKLLSLAQGSRNKPTLVGYLHNLISVQPYHNIRSSSMVTLARPPYPVLFENH